MRGKRAVLRSLLLVRSRVRLPQQGLSWVIRVAWTATLGFQTVLGPPRLLAPGSAVLPSPRRSGNPMRRPRVGQLAATALDHFVACGPRSSAPPGALRATAPLQVRRGPLAARVPVPQARPGAAAHAHRRPARQPPLNGLPADRAEPRYVCLRPFPGRRRPGSLPMAGGREGPTRCPLVRSGANAVRAICG